jgi:hypothetical protein
MEYMNKRLYEEKSKGLDGLREWPAHCHVTYHVHVAELKESTSGTFSIRPQASDAY